MNGSDQALVAAYLSGNKSAFDALTLRYLKLVYSVAMRYAKQPADAEDITQDVFVKVLKNLRRYDQDQAFKPWIITITKHASLDWLKKKKPFAFASFDVEREEALLSALADPAPLADGIVSQIQRGEMLRDAVKGLTPEQQQVVELRYKKGLTFPQIAETLGELLETVKARHKRGLITLKKSVQKNG